MPRIRPNVPKKVKRIGLDHDRRRTYVTWRDMHRRCEVATSRDFKDYGGRGISVCGRWQTFSAFLADMGIRSVGLTIERSDNDGNYEPGNCRWATHGEQAANKRSRTSSVLSVGGVSKIRRTGKYRAYRYVRTTAGDKKQIHLGTFATLEAAISAREAHS